MDTIIAALIPPGTEMVLLKKLGERYVECPTYISTHTARGKTIERELPLLRGATLIKRIDLGVPYLWEYVANITGDVKELGPVRLSEVERFKKRVSEVQPEPVPFIPKQNDRVRITAGLYTNQIGRVIWANKKITKIFVETSCNAVGAYLHIPTSSCTLASIANAPLQVAASQNKVPAKKRRGAFRKMRQKSQSA